MERIGPYTIECELSRGGMGVVYRAHDPQLDRPVAIKVLLAAGFGQDDLDWERFQQEARTTARLRHPNVVGIHSAGRADGHPYLVLDLIEGGSLHDRIQRDGPLDSREAATIARSMADALQYAHQKGVLHRDLKPANVLLEGETPLLADFGLSKLLGIERSGFTATGEIVGTPGFMSPEQASGEHNKLGPTTDVYGVGATLYAMLTGHPPFKRGSVLMTLDSVQTQRPVRPTRHRPELDPKLESICLRCLAKEPGERYPTAFALKLALDSYLDGGAASAAAPQPAPRRRTPLRPLALVLGGALLGGVLSVLPGVLDPADLNEEALRLRRRGSQRYDRGDFQGADADWTRVLQLSPNVSAVWHDRANARLGQDKFPEALADADHAASLEPPDIENLYFLRGKIHFHAEDYAAAIPELDRAIAIRPTDPVFFVQRAAAKERLGDAKGALSDYVRSLELDPRLKGSHHRQACVYFEEEDYDKALAQVAEALRQDANYSPALAVRGMVLENQGDHAGSLRAYEAALVPFLTEAATHLRNRASAFLKLGNWDDAATDSALAVKGEPENAEGHLMHGVARRAQAVIHQNAGRRKLALRIYAEALRDFKAGVACAKNEEEIQALRQLIDQMAESIRRLNAGR